MQEWCFHFTPGSFKVPIGTSQAFCAKLNDVRRRPKPLFQSKTRQLTAIDFKASMLKSPGRVPGDHCCWPVLADHPEKEAPVDEMAAEYAEVAEMAGEFIAAFWRTRQ